MRFLKTLVLGLAAVALYAPGPASAQTGPDSTTTKERGYVIECTGAYRGQRVWLSVYENNVFANVFQVTIGDGGTGASRQSDTGFVDDGAVKATIRLEGKKLKVIGTAERVGPRTPVHAEHDDAGQHVVEDGYHREVLADLSMKWKDRTIPLTCDNAFFYKLTVTKTDTTGD